MPKVMQYMTLELRVPMRREDLLLGRLYPLEEVEACVSKALTERFDAPVAARVANLDPIREQFPHPDEFGPDCDDDPDAKALEVEVEFEVET